MPSWFEVRSPGPADYILRLVPSSFNADLDSAYFTYAFPHQSINPHQLRKRLHLAYRSHQDPPLDLHDSKFGTIRSLGPLWLRNFSFTVLKRTENNLLKLHTKQPVWVIEEGLAATRIRSTINLPAVSSPHLQTCVHDQNGAGNRFAGVRTRAVAFRETLAKNKRRECFLGRGLSFLFQSTRLSR